MKVSAIVWLVGCAAALRGAELPRGFVVTLSNGAAQIARGRIAEGVDAHRVALWYVPELVATGATVVVAQALHELGRGLMKLGRLADAEEAFAAATCYEGSEFSPRPLDFCKSICYSIRNDTMYV